jgi:DNA-binding transcriptional regulator YiaG
LTYTDAWCYNRAVSEGEDVLSKADLKKLREGRGMSQQGLADLMDVARSTVARWETGAVKMPKPAQISARWLLTGKGN